MDWREQGLRTGDGQEVARLPKQELKRTELGHWDWRGGGGSDLEWVELAVSGRENKGRLKSNYGRAAYLYRPLSPSETIHLTPCGFSRTSGSRSAPLNVGTIPHPLPG